MTLNTISSGIDTSFSTKLNGNFKGVGIHEVYTGTGFNSSASGTTDEQSHELTAIPSANLGDSDYVRIKMLIECEMSIGGTGGSQSYVKIQSKEVGGTYSDSLIETKVFEITNDSSGTNLAVLTIDYLHALTAGEISNGVQFKIFSKSVSGGASVVSTVTNIQTSISSAIDI